MLDQRLWKIMQKRLGYDDDQLEIFQSNARNEEVVSKSKELFQKRFKVTIVEANGCNSRHKAGETFYLDGYGNLLKDLNPDKICIYAISAVSTLVFAAQELVYAGVDPNQMRFNRVGCIDVGLGCGGWGKIIMELTAENIGP
ncbi:MAG TPA: hypothetical protein VMX75_11715 [Spirochaetia bacterium]|nr:hypothetical protein [Spirochaetia bacterium]